LVFNIFKKKNQDPSPEKTSIFSRLKTGLSKTRQVLNTDINDLFKSSKAIDDELFDDLEEVLITSDLGVEITMALMEKIKLQAKKLTTADELKQVLKQELLSLFCEQDQGKRQKDSGKDIHKPHIIMVVGVNGTGKTTTIGKLAMKFTAQGNKVLIAAADTFRAAAIEQVQIWADRSNASIVKHKEGADPAAVAYDAVEAALSRNIDIVLIDTAGRLHTQKNLMEELKKIKRSINKKLPGAPHDVLMVLDATTGQNAISQATLFDQAVGLTQLALTKLDGTAKGGIVAAIAGTMKLPVTYIGVGEQINDLQDFEARRFVDALFD
jgi:fused signal recognition particle receptor